MSRFLATGTGLIAATLLSLFAFQLGASEAPRSPEWVRAEALYQKRLWVDAEKAFLAYTKHTPPRLCRGADEGRFVPLAHA